MNAEVLILRQTDYKDHDAIINALSKEGRYLTFFARGIKKPTSKNASSLQPFVLSNVMYFDSTKDMYLLKSASPITNYYSNFKSYDEMMAAHVVLEVINNMADLLVDADVEIYMLLLDSLQAIPNADLNLFLSVFLNKVLNLSGLSLVCDACAVCGRSQINYISVKHGGFICHDCLSNNDKAVYDLEVLKLFRIVNKANYEHIEKLAYDKVLTEEVLLIMLDFYTSYTGSTIRNIKQFIKSDVVNGR